MHFLDRSTYCSTWFGPQGRLSIQILFNIILGGKQTQLPKLSSINPFLQTQNPLKSNYFKGEQLRQSKSRAPLHVRHFGLHFWQTMFSEALSS